MQVKVLFDCLLPLLKLLPWLCGTMSLLPRIKGVLSYIPHYDYIQEGMMLTQDNYYIQDI